MRAMRSTRLLLTGTFILLLALPAAAPAKPHHPDRAEPLIIGHRGASGYRPEHTLDAYRLAAEQGADFIEPDLVITQRRRARRPPRERDRRHDRRRRPSRVRRPQDHQGDRRRHADRLVHRGLHARRAQDAARQGAHPAAAPAEHRRTTAASRCRRCRRCSICASGCRKQLGGRIGVYPETKHPTYFRSIGLPLEEPLVRALHAQRPNRREAPVFVQSFETGNLRTLRPRLTRAAGPAARRAGDRRPVRRHAHLRASSPRPPACGAIARYADGVGPSKDYIVPRNADQSSAAPTTLRRRRARRRAARPPLHVPAREQLPAAGAALVRRPRRHRRPAAELRQFFAPRRRRVLHRQPRHRRREPKYELARVSERARARTSRGCLPRSPSRATSSAGWAPSCSPARLAELQLIVTELVTNALVHGVGEVRLDVQVAFGQVRGAVPPTKAEALRMSHERLARTRRAAAACRSSRR